MTDDERRERYRVALAKSQGADPEWAFEWAAEADAAMALADAELRVKLGEQADRYMAVCRSLAEEQEEHARLLSELSQARAVVLRDAIAAVEDPFERALTSVGLGLGWEAAQQVLMRMLAEEEEEK